MAATNFRLIILGTIMGVGLTTIADSNCPVPAPISKTYPPSGIIRDFEKLSRRFLDLLNTDPPYSEIAHLMNETSSISWSDIAPILKGQIPFIVLIGIGSLFVLFLPIAGCCFCGFRCCGGKRVHTNPNSGVCYFLIVASLICFGLILSGTVLFALSSTEITIDSFQKDLNESANTMDELTRYFDNVPTQATCRTTAFFNDARSNTLNTSDSFFAMANTTIYQQIQSMFGVMEAGKPLLQKDAANLTENLKQASIQAGDLSNELEKESFTNKASIIATIKALQETASSASTNISGAAETLKILKLRDFLENNEEKVQKGIRNANQTTRNRIENAIQSTQQEVVNLLNDLNSTVSALTNETKNIRNEISNFERTVSDTLHSERQYVKYGDILLLILLLPLWLSLLFALGGLFCGCLGHEKDAEPYERSTTSNVGANSLLCSVCPLFTFGWLLMLLTMILFAAGYTANTMVCHPLWDDPNFSLLDEIQSVGGVPKKAFRNKSISKVFQECRANLSLTHIFNISGLTEPELNATIEGDGKESIKEAFSFFPPRQFAAIEKAMGGVKACMLTIENGLVTNNTQILEELLLKFPEQSYTTINVEIKELMYYLRKLNESAVESTADLQSLEFLISEDKILFRRNQLILELEAKLDQSLSSLQTYYLEESSVLLGQIYGSTHCGPLYTTYENTGVLVCDRFVSTIHGLWAGLGWSLLFVVPAIIFWISLSDYFRKMNYSGRLERRNRRRRTAPLTSLPRYDIVRPRMDSYSPPPYSSATELHRIPK